MTAVLFKSIRKQAGLTQRQLAERLRVGSRHVRAIELGERDPSGPVTLLMEQLAALNPVESDK